MELSSLFLLAGTGPRHHRITRSRFEVVAPASKMKVEFAFGPDGVLLEFGDAVVLRYK